MREIDSVTQQGEMTAESEQPDIGDGPSGREEDAEADMAMGYGDRAR